MLKIFYYFEGVISPLVRLNEPAFRRVCLNTLKSDLAFLTCNRQKEATMLACQAI